MSESKKFEFFKVLKENSSKNQYNDINDCILEWDVIDHNYQSCGHRSGDISDSDIDSDDQSSGCIDCICGEKCIYHIYRIKNTINNIILSVGSSCVKRFFEDTLYKNYKLKLKQIKEEKRQKEFNIRSAQRYLNDPKCELCHNRISEYCRYCHDFKKYLKMDYNIAMQKLNDIKYCKWLLDKGDTLLGDGKRMYNWLVFRNGNLIEIENKKKIVGLNLDLEKENEDLKKGN